MNVAPPDVFLRTTSISAQPALAPSVIDTVPGAALKVRVSTVPLDSVNASLGAAAVVVNANGVLSSAVGTLTMVICASAGGLDTVLVHGGCVLPGRHRPSGGVTAIVLTTCAGGAAATVAAIV